MAEVWLTKAPTADSRVGFKLKLNFGPATSNFIHAAEPGGSPYQNIQEAYVSYLAPAGKGLQIDAGVFVTPAGAEVIEAKDNPNYSRSLLFALAIPYYHSGVRATYAPNDKVSLMAGLVNGWNNIVENNTGKTILGSVTLKPNAKVTVAENYIVGPEEAKDNDHYRNVSDTIVTLSPDPMATVILNYDWGHEAVGGLGCGTTACVWQGSPGIVKLPADQGDRVHAALRVATAIATGSRPAHPDAQGAHRDARAEGERQPPVAHRVPPRLVERRIRSSTTAAPRRSPRTTSSRSASGCSTRSPASSNKRF